MTATTGPFPGRQPALVAGQPVARPRHDRLGNEVGRRPLADGGVIKAELRASWFRTILIDVWNVLPGPGVDEPQHRLIETDGRHEGPDELQPAG